jgi:hypothetical protein
MTQKDRESNLLSEQSTTPPKLVESPPPPRFVWVTWGARNPPKVKRDKPETKKRD